MQNAVLVESIPGQGYRALSGAPYELVAEAPTRDEALLKLNTLVLRRMATDGLVILPTSFDDQESAEISSEPPRDEDEDLDREWREAMIEYRREVDARPDPF
jgi:hypothetical protein